MNRYRTIPGLRGQQQASATTVCQKCLKKGHYSYECKSSAQERPYVSRPSRTQQLLNPKLAPELTNDAPLDLTRRDGVADQQLEKKAEERERIGRQPSSSPALPLSHSRKRSRSTSCSSSDSVSTISTGRSLSPKRARRGGDDQYFTSQQDFEPFEDMSRSTRTARKRRRSSSTESGSSSSCLDVRQPRNGRRRRNTISPESRGRPVEDRRGSRRSRSRDRSRDRSVGHSRIARGRKSMTPRPNADGVANLHSHRDQENRPGGRSERTAAPTFSDHRPAKSYTSSTPARQERSLSPYSKRLALTQAMNIG